MYYWKKNSYENVYDTRQSCDLVNVSSLWIKLLKYTIFKCFYKV